MLGAVLLLGLWVFVGGGHGPGAGSSAGSPAAGTAGQEVTAPGPSPADPAAESTDAGRVIVRCGDEELVDAPLLPGEHQPGDVWSPAMGTAEWWAAPGSPAPGEDSAYAAVIGAHSRNGWEPDVFARLDEMRPGCEVQVDLPEAPSAVFEVVELPTPVDKTRFTSAAEYDRFWEPRAPGTWLTLVTCDLESDLRTDGHLSGNIAVRATQVS